MSKTDEQPLAPPALIGHYIQCSHVLTCARKDYEVALAAAGRSNTTAEAARSLDEAIINMGKLISSLALGEMSVHRVGARIPS